MGAIRVFRFLVTAVSLSVVSTPGAVRGFGINQDAMTMQDCRDRLAQPIGVRAKSQDRTIDLDAVCLNMLSAARHPPRKKSATRAASAASR